MTIDDDDIKDLTARLKHYFDRELDQEIGDLKAGLLVDFIVEQFGPVIYNQAILDAQAYLQERVLDMEATLHMKR